MTAQRSEEHPVPSRTGDFARHDLTLAVSLSLCLFAIYLLTYRGGFHSIDEVSMYAVTESLVKFGQANTDQIAWTQWTTSQREAQGFFGTDGHVYSKKGLVLSLAMVPLYWLGLTIPGIGMLQTASLVNPIVTAATMGLLYLAVRRLGFGERVALVTSFICGLATIAWVYSKYLFSEPLAGLLLLGATYLVIAYRHEGADHWRAALAGVLLGLTVATRANNLFVVPVFVVYLWWVAARRTNDQLAREGRIAGAARPGRVSKWLSVRSLFTPLAFLAGLVPAGLLLLGYNWMRSGNPLQTGYDLTIFSPDLLGGLYKLLFSPLRGLFVYSPVLILSVPGLFWLWKRCRAEAALILGAMVVTLLLFAAWTSGEGLSWGARFLVPLVPLGCIALAPVVERAFARSTGVAIPLGVLCFVSLCIQVVGVAVNPWVYLARLQADFGGQFFLERTAALVDFRYTQILGQLQSWSVTNSDVAWWQPWGFDGLALGLCLALVAIAGLNLARLRGRSRFGTTLVAVGIASVVVPLALLGRYYQADRQFGPPGDPYTTALESAAARAGADDRIVSVAPYHYHVAMNRFKARLPLIGLARQPAPLPDTMVPLLSTALAGRDVWLVTVGFPAAAPDNEVEDWLAVNAFKASDEWIEDTRLVRYATARPAATVSLQASFGTVIRLLSASAPQSARPGETIPVELVWQSVQVPPANYNVFVQLLGPGGLPVAQHDGPPVGGYAPASGWAAGMEVRDRHAVVLPPGTPPGVYRLIAGLVDPATGKRLTSGLGADFVELGSVAVESGGG